jgi:hypothetical protein
MKKKVTVLQPVRRNDWLIRASTFEDVTTDNYTIMLTMIHNNHRDRLFIRFFEDDEKAADFVDKCAAGEYGENLDKEDS